MNRQQEQPIELCTGMVPDPEIEDRPVRTRKTSAQKLADAAPSRPRLRSVPRAE